MHGRMLYRLMKAPRLLALTFSLAAACSPTPAATPALDAGEDTRITAPPDRKCSPGENIQICGKNLVIAHRGGGLLAPEETMVAFQNAATLGVDVLELDVHATSDGVVVCMHDAEVDRMTDGKGKIKDMTFAELEKLDAGYKFTTDRGVTFPHRGKGLKVPKLEEVLAAFPAMAFSVELKQYSPSIVDATLAVVDATKMATKIVFASFDDETIFAIRKKRPELTTSLAAGEMVAYGRVTPDTTDYVLPTKILQAPIGLATDEKMQIAWKYGARVHVWTINDRAEMESLLLLGVHGVMTDDPALLLKVVSDMGRSKDKNF